MLLAGEDWRRTFDALRHHATEATDTLLIYFAGHGLRKLRGGLYLALPHTQFANAAEWSEQARQEALAVARERERQRRAAAAERERERLAEEEERERQRLPEEEECERQRLAEEEECERQRLAEEEECERQRLAEEEERRRKREARERRRQQQQEAEQRRQAEEPLRQEQRRRAEEEARQRQLVQAQEQERRQQRLREWRAAEAVRMRPATRSRAVLRALALAAAWAFTPIVAIWLSWWFSSYEFDAAQVLSWLACVFSLAALYRLVPCALRLGGAFRPRLRTPSTLLPPARAALTASALILVYGLIGSGSSSRADDLTADSGLLRDRGLNYFLTYVGQNSSSSSFGDTLIALLLLPVAAGCLWVGLQAGRATARRWEQEYTRAQQEARRLAGHQ